MTLIGGIGLFQCQGCKTVEILAAQKARIVFVAVMIHCSLVGGYQRFGETFWSYLQEENQAVRFSLTLVLIY